MERLFLGRHASVVSHTETISNIGETEIGMMVAQLKTLELSDSAILMSAHDAISVRTARLIVAEYHFGTVVRCKYVFGIGELPEMAELVRNVFSDILTASGVRHDDRDVVAITGEPLLDAVYGSYTAAGTLYEMPQNWHNFDYDPHSIHQLHDPDSW